MAIEEYVKFELQCALREAKKVAETLPPTHLPYGLDGEASVVTFLDIQLRTVLLKKVEEEIRSKVSFYNVEQLCYLLEKLHEKPKTETKPVFGIGDTVSAEIQPKPALQSSGEQKLAKGSKKPVLKRV